VCENQVSFDQSGERFSDAGKMLFDGLLYQPPMRDSLQRILGVFVFNQVSKYFTSDFVLFVSHVFSSGAPPHSRLSKSRASSLFVRFVEEAAHKAMTALSSLSGRSED
jgi:hypothetical protein